MRAGALRHRLVIESSTESRDAVGGAVLTWSTFTTRWAAVEPLSGREFFDARQVNAAVDHRIRLRSDATTRTITPRMRARLGARLFALEAVLGLEAGGDEVSLLAREVA